MGVTLIVTLTLVILLVANVIAWKFVVNVFRQEVETLSKMWSIEQNVPRVEQMLKDLDSLSLAADRASSVVTILERKIATAVKLCDTIEHHQQWITDVLTQRSISVTDYVSDDVLQQVVNSAMHRLERAIPEIILTKVGKYGMEFTVLNTLESAEVDINIQLRDVPYEKLRVAIIKGLARLPLQGKPKEEQIAQQWVNKLFGSDDDFEMWWNGLQHSILDYQLRGNLVVAPKSGVARPLKVVK